MGRTIRARVKEGVFEPLEKIDLPEGEEVVSTIVTTSPTPDWETFRSSAGGWA